MQAACETLNRPFDQETLNLELARLIQTILDHILAFSDSTWVTGKPSQRRKVIKTENKRKRKKRKRR